MKKLILSSLLAVAALSASAAEASITYTYAGNDLLSWGRFKAETYDVAIRLNDPALVGKKITSLRAVLNASEGIESTSLWLSKELKLENIDGVKKNVPDTYSKEVAVEKVVIPGVAESMRSQTKASMSAIPLSSLPLQTGRCLPKSRGNRSWCRHAKMQGRSMSGHLKTSCLGLITALTSMPQRRFT